jgi:hypothetical protein
MEASGLRRAPQTDSFRGPLIRRMDYGWKMRMCG